MSFLKKTLFSAFFLGVWSLQALQAEASLSEILKKTYEAPKGKSKLQKFYQKNNYEPVWVRHGHWTPQAVRAIEVLKNSHLEGLDPKRYQRVFELEGKALQPQSQAFQMEKDLTQLVLQYIDDVRNGSFDRPRRLHHLIHIRPDPVNTVELLYKGVHSKNVNWLDDMPPQNAEYKALKGALGYFFKLLKADYWPEITVKKIIEPGDHSTQIPLIRAILILLGDMTFSFEARSDENRYDSQMVRAVKYFQSRHGLKGDGVIGADTVKKLNMTPKERVRDIIIAMERWRWMPRNLGKRYIFVNIPNFELKAFESDALKVSSKVIVGTRARPTPIFQAKVTDIVFNPYWHVPYSIAVRDKLPTLQEYDPVAFFQDNNYMLYRKNGEGKFDRVEDIESIDWSEYSSKRFPFRIKQRPGGNNALGRIKLNMHNKFSVYLHSTPLQDLFKEEKRVFSSGCMRVENIVDLTEFVMNKERNWNRYRIQDQISGAPKTRTVPLRSHVPVYVTYFAVGVNADGALYFVPDIYRQDQQVEKEIFKG